MAESTASVVVHNHCLNPLQNCIDFECAVDRPVTFFNGEMAKTLAFLGSMSASGNRLTLQGI